MARERVKRHRAKRSGNALQTHPEVETETEVETDTPKSPQSGDQHDGRHQNCRQCGTNPRAQPPVPIAPVELVVDPNPACPTCKGSGEVVIPGEVFDQHERCYCTYFTPDEGAIG
jgi:hypothetical protein